jgi:phage shock protein E
MYSLTYTCSGAETYSLYVPGKACSMSRAHLISSGKARRMIDKGVISVIVDVRADAEWSQGHYTDAKHIPFHTVSETTIRRNNIKKDDVVLVYCNTGHRAKYASEMLKSFGFKNVFYVASNHDSFVSTPCQTASSEKYALPLTPVTTA